MTIQVNVLITQRIYADEDGQPSSRGTGGWVYVGSTIAASNEIFDNGRGIIWRKYGPSGWLIDHTPSTTYLSLVMPDNSPIDAVVSLWSDWTGGDWSACSNGTQQRAESRTRSIVTPARNGGLTPPLSDNRMATRPCVTTPPPDQTDTLYVWGGNPMGVYRDTFGQPQDLIGTLAADPTFEHPIIVVPSTDNSVYAWVKIVGGDVDPKFIGGYAVRGQYPFTYLAHKPSGLQP